MHMEESGGVNIVEGPQPSSCPNRIPEAQQDGGNTVDDPPAAGNVVGDAVLGANPRNSNDVTRVSFSSTSTLSEMIGIVEEVTESEETEDSQDTEDSQETEESRQTDDSENREREDDNDKDDDEVTISWQEATAIIREAAAAQTRESSSSSEQVTESLSFIKCQRDSAYEMIDILTEERRDLIAEKIDLQVKLAAAIKKRNDWKAYHDRIKQELEEMEADLRTKSAEDTASSASSSVDAGHNLQGEDVVRNERKDQAGGPDRGKQRAQTPIESAREPWHPQEGEQPSREAYQALLDKYAALRNDMEWYKSQFHYLSQKDLDNIQLCHDLYRAWEDKRQLQDQLNRQADQYWYMRNIYSQYLDRLKELSSKGPSNPTAEVKSAIGESLIYQADLQRVQRDLDSIKMELKRVKRDKARMLRGRIAKRQEPRASSFNLRPLRAELRAHMAMNQAFLREHVRHRTRFLNAIEIISTQYQDGATVPFLVEQLRDEIDRNEQLVWDIWHTQHPDVKLSFSSPE
ncbi:hypothetical protein VTO42DRAFT_3224 [Malbranchea cinnamomea]